MSYSVLPWLLILFLLWRGRHEFAHAWRYRHIFRPRFYWGVAALYAISGAAITLSAFGAPHLQIKPASTAMQIVAGAGILSLGLVRILAGKLARPVFERNDVPQKDRNYVHGLWMMYWLLGLALGFLPVFLPTPA